MHTLTYNKHFDIWNVNYRSGSNIHYLSTDDASLALMETSRQMMLNEKHCDWWVVMIDNLAGLSLRMKQGYPSSISTTSHLTGSHDKWKKADDSVNKPKSKSSLPFELLIKFPWENDKRLLSEHHDEMTAKQAAIAIIHAYHCHADFKVFLKDNENEVVSPIRNIDV